MSGSITELQILHLLHLDGKISTEKYNKMIWEKHMEDLNLNLKLKVEILEKKLNELVNFLSEQNLTKAKVSTDEFSDVGDFHKVCEAPFFNDEKPACFPHMKIRLLRMRLLLEEVGEYIEAEMSGDIVAVADALTDIKYIVNGTGHTHNIDLNACWQEIHRSNMSKIENGKVLRREDGKIQKPDSYSPPDLKPILSGNKK